MCPYIEVIYGIKYKIVKNVKRDMYGINFEWGGYGNNYVNIYDLQIY